MLAQGHGLSAVSAAGETLAETAVAGGLQELTQENKEIDDL